MRHRYAAVYPFVRFSFALLFALLSGPLLVVGVTTDARADLLVTGVGNPSRVLRYGATGQFEGSISDPALGQEPGGVAFGPDRNIYVGNFGVEVANFPPTFLSNVLRFNGTTFQSMGVFAEVNPLLPATPTGLTFGPDNNLYVATFSSSGNSVLKFNGSTGQLISTFVPSIGGGPKNFLKFGPDGNLYVSAGTNGVKRFNGTTGALIDTFVDTQDVLTGLDFGPDGNLYVADLNDVLRFNGTTGAFIDVFVPPGSGGLNVPEDIKFGSDGLLYVASFGTDSILRFNAFSGAFVDEFVAPGPGSGGLSGPTFLALSPAAVSGPSTFILVSIGLGVLGVAAQFRHGPRRCA